MEKFKKTIRIRIILLDILVFAAVCFGVYDVFLAPEEIKNSEIFSFQCGIALALGLAAIAGIILCTKALKSDKALRKQFNRENDERMRAIRAKAGVPMILICSVLMIIAAVIIGYRNVAVFRTLVAAAVVQVLIACIVKAIYTKIM